MSELTVIRGVDRAVVRFAAGERLSDVLNKNGCFISQPCGGRGVCGKCAVDLEGVGSVLACRTVLTDDAVVRLPEQKMEQIETETAVFDPINASGEGFGAAIDIGTTTLALALYDLRSGERLAVRAAENPQRAVAADVIGRIGAATEGRGEELKTLVTDAIRGLLDSAEAEAGGKAQKLVCTGNTTMLYLLTGRDPVSLSHAPFVADTLFGCETTVLDREALLPPCMNAFVGADITCAVLASGICERDETALLMDIGTNGELALWHNGTLYVTSTAAGPAFEGAGISCGCGSVEGAIDRVSIENGCIRAHTIGGAKAVGVCGSGLLDAIAAGLELELIDETGAMEDDSLPLADGVALLPKDVRAVQLAKGAIRAGMETLLATAVVEPRGIAEVLIAGGFGSHLNINSAVRIGLLPEAFRHKARAIGNAALAGAAMLLLDEGSRENAEKLAAVSVHVNLGGNARFNEEFIEQMMF